MESVKLKNGAVLEFKEIQSAGYLSFIFENQDITEIRTLFDNPVNLASIEILTEGGATCAVYNGYTIAYKYILQENLITVYLDKPDETQQSIKDLQQHIDDLSNTIVIISMSDF